MALLRLCSLLLLLTGIAAIVPGRPPTTTLRHTHHRAALLIASAATTEPTATGNPALDDICERADAAVTLSTGAGMESSGSGRPEWGTWCDTDLFKDARVALNNVSLETTAGEWPALWTLAGGEAPTATLRIAGGQLTAGGAGGWDLLLHLFSARGAAEERAVNVKYEDGTLSLLKPLLGSMRISKFRTDGEVLGVPKELKGGSAGLGGKAADRAFLQLGGPPHEVTLMQGCARGIDSSTEANRSAAREPHVDTQPPVVVASPDHAQQAQTHQYGDGPNPVCRSTSRSRRPPPSSSS